MTHISALYLLPVACLAVLFAAPAVWRCLWLGGQLRAAVVRRVAEQQREASVTRTLQLFVQELQNVALTLRGHADHLAADRHVNAPRMAVTAAQLGGLADELCQHVLPVAQKVVLACEEIVLADLVADAVRATQNAISPGFRHFRVRQPIDEDLRIWGDPRGLGFVLARVLGEAVRTSSHDDWIDIGCTIEADRLLLRIEDEGAGSAASGGMAGNAASAGIGVRFDSRGIGLRLSLARSLVLAHGGALEVEALARVGTRVTIQLPSERLRMGLPVTGGSFA